MQKNPIAIIILAVVTAAGGFFGGMKYQQSKQPSFAGFIGNRTATGNRNTFRATVGDVIASDDKSITVKLAYGSSKIVLFSDKTEIYKTDTTQKNDLKVGDRVMVTGSNNSDGSQTAENIQINPPIRVFPSGAPTGTQ